MCKGPERWLEEDIQGRSSSTRSSVYLRSCTQRHGPFAWSAGHWDARCTGRAQEMMSTRRWKRAAGGNPTSSPSRLTFEQDATWSSQGVQLRAQLWRIAAQLMFESRTPFPNWCEQHNPPSSKTQGVSEEIRLQRTGGNSRMALSRWFPVSAQWHWRAAHMWSIDSCKVQLPIAVQSRSHSSYQRSSTGYAGPQVAAGQVHPTETLPGSPHLYTAHTPGATGCTSSPKNEKLQCSRHSDRYVYKTQWSLCL